MCFNENQIKAMGQLMELFPNAQQTPKPTWISAEPEPPADTPVLTAPGTRQPVTATWGW